MDEKKEQLRENRRRLKSLLDGSRHVSTRLDDTTYLVAFTGKFRDWSIRTHIYNGWLCFSVFVMQLPETPGVRATLMERVLRLNAETAIAKFSVSDDMLKLELESRAELVDDKAFGGLMGHFYSVLEANYMPLARMAAGDETLTALQSAFERPSLTAGAE